ncbi:glycosyltransferase family 4 protein [Paenibacillus puldeungensis]|uniref:Glycosyltransferase family 4 protein n=2 Tax=Paenibacillus puldeungensis TaxID=696536 RepID=A0ABW3RTG7_9BACL
MKGKAAYVATVYSHLAVFHLPFMHDLRARGYEVHAYAAPDHCREEVEKDGFTCRDLPFSRSPLAIGNVKALFDLMKWLKRERYEFIHVHTPNASVVCRLAAALTGSGNVVYTAHGFHFYSGAPWRNWLLYYPMERMLSRLTDVLVTINREDYERAAAFPVRGKVVYVPGVGVDLAAYGSNIMPESGEFTSIQLKKELGLQPDDFAILCIAELNRNKNQQQLIEAVRELRSRSIPAVLLLAGTGEAEPEYRRLVAELGLQQEVRFLGFRRDIPRLLQAADVLGLLSRREGLPKALLEGLAAGKPLVATDVRGSRDLVTDGHNGYVVPVGDTGAADAFEKLYKDAELRQLMGEYSRGLAAQYDLMSIRAEISKIYMSLGVQSYGHALCEEPKVSAGAGERRGSI